MTGGGRSHDKIVAKFKGYLEAHPNMPLYLPEICAAKRPDNRHDVCFNQSRVAGNLGGRAVATQIVMDHTGDTRHHFDAKDSQALAKAEERFEELMRLGFTAAVRTAASEVTRVRSFDPTAEETLFFPRLVGG